MGVCLEDKLFPKTNSFIGDHQPLADVDEFCGKIKAGRDSATDPDFSIVARVEALIAVHVVLDNAVHDSTGGQATVSPNVDFAAIALACGYATGASADSLDGFERAWAVSRDQAGPHLIHVRIAPGSLARLGRPTITPPEVARRFRAFLAGP